MKNHSWIRVLNSPFKLPKLRWYIGKIAIGVPYFLPRKTVKSKTKKGWLEFKPLTIGFSSCGLGWKTKWTETDYRYEWSPVFSFVFFKWQIACMVGADHCDNYWCSWLYYENNTDRTKSKKERIQQCIKEFPQIWAVHERGKEEKIIDYYPLILKKKYGYTGETKIGTND